MLVKLSIVFCLLGSVLASPIAIPEPVVDPASSSVRTTGIGTSTSTTRTTTRTSTTTTTKTTTNAPTVSIKSSTTTSSTSASACYVERRPRATGPPIKAVTLGTPVYDLQLYDSGGNAVLRTNGLHQGWKFTNGGIAKFEWTPNCYAYKYLNIEASSTSYKPLTWSYTQFTYDWTVPSGTDIGTLASSIYGAHSDFLICSVDGWWRVYLQTGTDVPPGVTCVTTKLRVW